MVNIGPKIALVLIFLHKTRYFIQKLNISKFGLSTLSAVATNYAIRRRILVVLKRTVLESDSMYMRHFCAFDCALKTYICRLLILHS